MYSRYLVVKLSCDDPAGYAAVYGLWDEPAKDITVILLNTVRQEVRNDSLKCTRFLLYYGQLVTNFILMLSLSLWARRRESPEMSLVDPSIIVDSVKSVL